MNDEPVTDPELVPNPPAQALQKMDAGAIAAAGGVGDMSIEELFKMALANSPTVDTLRGLMELRRQMQAEFAEKVFNEAMKAFQNECPVIVKTRPVYTDSGQHAYSYASMDDILGVIQPYLDKYGFSFHFDQDTATKPGSIFIVMWITHTAGHKRPNKIELPVGRGTRMMSDTQVAAGTLTFCNRRALENGFGLKIRGQDNDGAGARTKPEPPGKGGGKATASATEEAAKERLHMLTLKRKLTDVTRDIHQVKQGYSLDQEASQKLLTWLTKEGYITANQRLGDMTVQQITDVIDAMGGK